MQYKELTHQLEQFLVYIFLDIKQQRSNISPADDVCRCPPLVLVGVRVRVCAPQQGGQRGVAGGAAQAGGRVEGEHSVAPLPGGPAHTTAAAATGGPA